MIVGNFMADAVKGRDLSGYPHGLQRGIRLHRAMDAFTDRHDAHLQGRQRARRHAGRYASVVMDLFYDHLLAARWELFHPMPLQAYAARMYNVLTANAHRMPERTQRMLPHMVAGDWLASYASIEGIGRALEGLSSRAPEGGPMRGSEKVLREHMDAYTQEFSIFMVDMEAFTRTFR